MATATACDYMADLFPMVPTGGDVKFDRLGVPLLECEHRALVNHDASNHWSYWGSNDSNGQWLVDYTHDDLLADIHGLELARWGDRGKELKELQAHKELLDHVAFLVSIGEMTEADLEDTQDSVHEALKDGHNRYYHFFDLRQFPGNFIRDPSTGLVDRCELCTFLRKNYKVWYVSFQGNRVVAMGSLYLELVACMDKLHDELRLQARGAWSTISHMTERYEHRTDEMERLYEQEIANSYLISETWGISIEDTEKILTSAYNEELGQEEQLRVFACTGKLPIDQML